MCKKLLFNAAENLFLSLESKFHQSAMEVVNGESYDLAEAIAAGKTEEFFAPLKALASLVSASAKLMHAIREFEESPPVI